LGGGYDMDGTAFGDVLNMYYPDRLRTLLSNCTLDSSNPNYVECKKFYELIGNSNTGEMRVDGRYGVRSVEIIAEAIGLDLRRIRVSKNVQGYVIIDTYSK
jgi:hypothetical protein